MDSKLVVIVTLAMCGTLCVVATLGLAAYLLKKLSESVVDGRIQDAHMLLVGVVACPGLLTLGIGVTLLALAVRHGLANGSTKSG